MSTLRSVPSLDELAAHPARAAEVPPGVAGDLLGACEAMLVRYQHLRDALLIRAAVGEVAAGWRNGASDLVGVEEAAELLGRSTDWIYRNARALPFTVQEGKGHRLRFSRSGIERYIREHQSLTG
ncbi:MAG: helix-turn-helix domain-containing protein [Candidatus Binatia bacterium]